jgi:hypothetical protein
MMAMFESGEVLLTTRMGDCLPALLSACRADQPSRPPSGWPSAGRNTAPGDGADNGSNTAAAGEAQPCDHINAEIDLMSAAAGAAGAAESVVKIQPAM